MVALLKTDLSAEKRGTPVESCCAGSATFNGVNMRLLIAERYNWNKIAEQTIEVYKKALTS